MCFFKSKKVVEPELFQTKTPEGLQWVSTEFPPDHSCRVLICFDELDSRGLRVVSTGTYMAAASGFVIDDFQARFFSPYKYVERNNLNVPE